MLQYIIFQYQETITVITWNTNMITSDVMRALKHFLKLIFTSYIIIYVRVVLMHLKILSV